MAARHHEPFLSTLIAVSSILVAVFLSLLNIIAHWLTAPMLFMPYILAILVGAAVVLIARHVQLHKALELLPQLLHVNRLAGDIYELSCRGETHAARCTEIIELIGKIEEQWARVAGTDGIKRWKYGTVLQELRRVAEGEIIIDNPNKELTTNEEFLEELCRDKTRAVSYKDEPFWQAPEGRTFLAKQKHLILTRRITITLIFILDKATTVEAFTPIMRAHRDAGIHVRYLAEDALLPPERADFVVYDEAAVRVGEAKTLQTRADEFHNARKVEVQSLGAILKEVLVNRLQGTVQSSAEG